MVFGLLVLGTNSPINGLQRAIPRGGSSFTLVSPVVLQTWNSAPTIVQLLRSYLSLLAAQHSFSFRATHVAGKLNPVVGALSRFNFQKFYLLAPHAASKATPIPRDLLEELQVL